jgi:regulator of replication initiation timing
MPRRSITRFFIPLIDVLILLFCIFLLLEYNSESKSDEKFDQQTVQAEIAGIKSKALEEALANSGKELQKLEDLRPELDKVGDLREENRILKAENERLRGKRKKLEDIFLVHRIDVDVVKGSISWLDETNAADPVLKIEDAETARKLIGRHRKEASGRGLVYKFVTPFGKPGKRPNPQEWKMYESWFEGVDHDIPITAAPPKEKK